MYKGKHVLTIEEKHIGKRLGVKGHPCAFAPLGVVLECDVGKQLFLYNGVYYVENQEQFEERIRREIISDLREEYSEYEVQEIIKGNGVIDIEAELKKRIGKWKTDKNILMSVLILWGVIWNLQKQKKLSNY